MLSDTCIQVGGAINLAGLNDQTGSQIYRMFPKAIRGILQSSDRSLPIVLMHHTPARMKEAAQEGVDLMFSGHTHGGQIWPLKNVVEATFRVKHGLSKIGNMNFYLTTGFGTYGPPIRICAAPEILIITLRGLSDSVIE